MKRLMLIMTAAFVLCGSAFAQTDQVRTISGGVLNGKAVSLPKPVYPADAKESKAEGVVAVDVEIDEQGTVVSAVSQPYDQAARKNEDGSLAEMRELHPALRTSAETAALSAKFSPTLLSGQPARVKGQIVYHFVAGAGSTTKQIVGISGGVLNGKARSLPTPEYPQAALAVRAGGAVSVQVTVDEEGNVISASAVSGHPLLRAAAVSAAKEAKFGPVLLNGQPVKVSGVVTYNFTPAGGDKPDNR